MADASQTAADIVDLLKADHDKARALMKDLKNESGDKRKSLLNQLRIELLVHSDVEREIVYPAFEEEVGDRDAKVDVAESLEEHRIVKETLDDLKDLDPGSIQFDAKLKLLTESVEHHAKEEEKEMFPKLREAASEDRLHALATEVEERKQELQKKQK